MQTLPCIATGTLTRQSLAGQVVIVTGAGSGIGLETARSLAWLGAKAVIAEVDHRTGKSAEETINRAMGPDSALFIQTDVGDEGSIESLSRQCQRAFSRVDAVINNAAIEPFGPIKDVPVKDWDASYRVNLRGPVLLARAFVPGMIARKYGVFICVSSVGGPYMAPYESFKSAQVEMARALEAELEDSGVIVFTIGPGLVRTQGAETGIRKIATLYGKTVEEFYQMSKEAILSVEAAGSGFAASVALAAQFKGLEIGAIAALNAANISLEAGEQGGQAAELNAEQAAEALALCREVRATFVEQSEGWKKRPIFERQWMLRDFKQYAGQPAETCQTDLQNLEAALDRGDFSAAARLGEVPGKIAAYYQHYAQLTRSYVKDPQKLQKILDLITGWQKQAEKLAQILQSG